MQVGVVTLCKGYGFQSPFQEIFKIKMFWINYLNKQNFKNWSTVDIHKPLNNYYYSHYSSWLPILKYLAPAKHWTNHLAYI